MKKVVSVTSNLIATSVAAVLSASLIMSGTWAWQSFDQEVINKTSDSFGAGGRLHTNFDGVNKHVFVENYKSNGTYDISYGYSDLEPGTDVRGGDIYVRVRLTEYLQIDENTGTSYDENIYIYPTIDGREPDIEDANTWDVIKMYETDSNDSFYGILDEGKPIARDYVELVFGGQGVYMPTFDRSDNSSVGIVNGTLGGDDKDITTMDDAYLDFENYEVVGEKSEDTTYDDENGDSYTRNETHYAQMTLESTGVISMNKWLENMAQYEFDYKDYQAELANYEIKMARYVEELKQWDKAGAVEEDKPEEPEKSEGLVEPEAPIGAFWVFDTDGWIYWAQPLEPQTATGLLLKQTLRTDYANSTAGWYYEISTSAQYATRGDWNMITSDDDISGHWGSLEGDLDNDQTITVDALELLQTISGTAKFSFN